MCKRALLLPLLLLLLGCTDSLGLAADCSREMREVRRQHGAPDSVQRGGGGGSQTERWYYDSPRVHFTFTWGTNQPCLVEGPVHYSRSPG